MRALMAFLKRIQIGKVVTAFLLGAVLLTMTACNNGDQLGARPNNPPVQMGGQNNPHKAGGDGYSEYKTTIDPVTKPVQSPSKERASLPQAYQLVAANADNNDRVLLYPGSNDVKSADSRDDFTSPQRQKELLDPRQIPAPQQPVVNRSDPDAKILEKVGQSFKDASEFLAEPPQE